MEGSAPSAPLGSAYALDTQYHTQYHLDISDQQKKIEKSSYINITTKKSLQNKIGKETILHFIK